MLTNSDQERNSACVLSPGKRICHIQEHPGSLDGSFVGEAALLCARALAGRTGASLTLVRAAQIPMVGGNRGTEHTRIVAETEAYLAARAEELTADGFTVQIGVPFGGSAATWITEEVSMRHADLIVIATHDRLGPNRWLHGSVAEAVISRASVPVLLMRASEDMRPIERFGVQRPGCRTAEGWLAPTKEADPMPLPVHAPPPGENHLLALLPQAEYEELLPDLEHVRLVHKTILTRPGEQISHVYFSPPVGDFADHAHERHQWGRNRDDWA